MLRNIFAVGAVVVASTGAAIAAPVGPVTLDVYIASNFNTSTGTVSGEYVDTSTVAGSITLQYDDADGFPDLFAPSVDVIDFVYNPFPSSPTSFDLSLNIGSVAASFSTDMSDFIFAEAGFIGTGVDASPDTVDFAIDTFVSGEIFLDNGLILTDITAPGFGVMADFLRYDASGNLVGVNVEIQTLAPVPLPAALPMLAAGVLLLGRLRKTSDKA